MEWADYGVTSQHKSIRPSQHAGTNSVTAASRPALDLAYSFFEAAGDYSDKSVKWTVKPRSIDQAGRFLPPNTGFLT